MPAKRVERVGSDAGAAAPGLRDAIEEAAAHQGRTISNMVDAVECQFLPELSASSYLECHGQKRELGGVTITRGDLTSPGPLQKGVYSLRRADRMSAFGGKADKNLDGLKVEMF